MIGKTVMLLAMVMALPKAGVTESDRVVKESIEGMTNLVDAVTIGHIADSLGVPPTIMWSIAWEESGTGRRGNDVYGHGTARCRAIGRMQINPCAHWNKVIGSECERSRLVEYRDNIICSAKILRYQHDVKHMTWPSVVRHYNGSGPKAYAYRKRVLRRIRMLTLSIPVAMR